MTHNFTEDTNFSPLMQFGEFLRKKRRLMGLNQTDFAEILGYTQGTISMWELGVTSPYYEDANEIIRRLGGCLLIVNFENKEINPYEIVSR